MSWKKFHWFLCFAQSYYTFHSFSLLYFSILPSLSPNTYIYSITLQYHPSLYIYTYTYIVAIPCQISFTFCLIPIAVVQRDADQSSSNCVSRLARFVTSCIYIYIWKLTRPFVYSDHFSRGIYIYSSWTFYISRLYSRSTLYIMQAKSFSSVRWCCHLRALSMSSIFGI